jgi:hypothetical protein
MPAEFEGGSELITYQGCSELITYQGYQGSELITYQGGSELITYQGCEALTMKTTSQGRLLEGNVDGNHFPVLCQGMLTNVLQHSKQHY